MYELVIKASFYEMVFVFDSFGEAGDFLEKAMTAINDKTYKFEIKKVVK